MIAPNILEAYIVYMAVFSCTISVQCAALEVYLYPQTRETSYLSGIAQNEQNNKPNEDP